MSSKVWIDAAHRHHLWLEQQEGSLRATLKHARGDRRSLLHESLLDCLRLRMDDAEARRLDAETETLRWSGGSRLDVLLVDEVGGRLTRLLGSVELTDGLRQAAHFYELSPFECRVLAETGSPQVLVDLGGSLTPTPPPRTDLHTHFSGCIVGADLVELGVAAGILYPVERLEEAGIHVHEDVDALPLSALTPSLRARLAEQLSISGQSRITFLDMEQIYRLRTPIVKNFSCFRRLCQKIAEDYQRMGVQYAELSLSNICEARRLRAVHEWMPEIRRQTGVDLRFLAAMSRHDDLEWDLDYIERLQTLQSPYIVGVDVMGHETNSTHAFATQLEKIVTWADAHRPGFVLRVHAGENPAHPENVRVAVELARGYDVQLRIGHGLYGVDEETLALLVEEGVIIEYNLNSNLALNNIQSAVEVPLRRYLRGGVSMVLGTDGYGIYETNTAMELRAARLSGLEEADTQKIYEVEEKYLARRAAYDKKTWFQVGPVPDDPAPKHFNPARVEARRRSLVERRAQLNALLLASSVPSLTTAALSELMTQRRYVISFAGAWRKSWEKVSETQRSRIEEEVSALFSMLPPDQSIILTGGTRFGVEHVVQRRAREHGLMSIGTLAADIHPEYVDVEHISHAFIIAETIYHKAAALYRLVQSNAGVCIFIGGGAVVSDEIQTARNLRIRHLLMDGPEGASSQHARQHPHLAWRHAEQVIEALSGIPWRSTEGSYWYLGANPTADAIILRRHPQTDRREILLVRRHRDAPTEPGKWALPGGFVHTDAPRGHAWREGVETPREACLRELLEETGLDLSASIASFRQVGVYENKGRDPRDTEASWSRSVVFAWVLPRALVCSAVAGGDDADDALWIPVDRLPWLLAFDHAAMIKDALAQIVF